MKKWFGLASFLLIFGIMICVGALTACAKDLGKLDMTKYERNEHEITEDFDNIFIQTISAEISFVLSEDGNCKVVCEEEKNLKHSVNLEEGKLFIIAIDQRKWHEHLFNFGKTSLTIYLPQSAYALLNIQANTGDIEIPNSFAFERVDIQVSTGNVKCYASASENIKIKTSTGDIRLENITTGTLDLSVSTGKINVLGAVCAGDMNVNVSTGDGNLTNITCKNLTSNGDTGDLSLNNVIATEKFSIVRTTGKVEFEACDAMEIFVKTSTGKVVGTLLSEKIFIPKTSTGDIKVPDTTTGGKCEISTSTGDIKISIAGR